MPDDMNPDLNTMADSIQFKNPFTLEGTQTASPSPQDGQTQQPETSTPTGQQDAAGASNGLTPDQAAFGMSLLGQAPHQNGPDLDKIKDKLNVDALKDKVGDAWQKMKANKSDTSFQLGGLYKAADTYATWYKAAKTPPTDVPPLGVKIIDSDDEISWRPRTQQEIDHAVGSIALATAIPTAFATQNMGKGSFSGWLVGEKGARYLLEETNTPEKLYIRRGDIQKFEQGLADYGKAAEAFKEEYDKPYWD